MTDRELLRMAAKAAGIETRYQPMSHRFLIKKPLSTMEGTYFAYWDPLTDDGDALRLAVKTHLWIGQHEDAVTVSDAFGRFKMPLEEDYGDDPCAATRRAIVRAAAEIGETMK